MIRKRASAANANNSANVANAIAEYAERGLPWQR
jgi:hypothetical protein